jgi:uncharacterized UBP type Zn finger protein
MLHGHNFISVLSITLKIEHSRYSLVYLTRLPGQCCLLVQGAHATTLDPMESSITTLVSMGFDRASAVQALALTNNDVNLASNILLEAQLPAA